MNPAQDFYEQLRTRQLSLYATSKKEYDRFAIVRLVVILALLVAVVLAFGYSFLAGFLSLPVFVGVSYFLVKKHDSIKRTADRAEIRAALADRELGALNHDFRVFDGGDDLLDPAHPYALDLDIFGPHSLFQFLNRTVTAGGRRSLADALLAPQDQDKRARTQVQGKDLSAMPAWCLEFRMLGEGLNDSLAQQQRLRDWLLRPAVVQSGLDKALLYVIPFLTIGSIAAMLLIDPWFVGLIGLVPAVLLYRKYSAAIATEHAYTSAMGSLLKQYADLLQHADGWSGASADVARSVPAIRKLSYYISQLDVRSNPFAMLVELGGAWSMQWLTNLDGWRETYREELPVWLDTIARVDTLVSWATLRYNHPDWVDPEFTDEPVFQATGLGHPLLNPAGRITNDIDMRTDGHIHLVTGSNMAGKSTWLRTVGINLVLAQAGSPVCALHLRQRPLHVWTSMRTQDDLSESTSSFYAELKRLQSIIRAVSEKDEDVFFLLDEILKGTNSRDRHTGSRALIRQLIRDQGAGIIATHDLELAVLENEPGSRVENYAMEVQTRGDDLVFDYKLHPGVCTSFNATALMARMGIEIPAEEIKLHHD
ncbi:MutS-related protein [Neolewinella antarctica]|uniref:Ca2+/Na+ antiporter n=1 Tax=Neolewinella antarctica TaxID=442734 RepID=A0ABX0X9G5_9BACT|nr:hypothetical protein [Neolewinella antarctica]NJC25872.1 Ca2+/Na+ antiporter [Neolewinella antarctica]